MSCVRWKEPIKYWQRRCIRCSKQRRSERGGKELVIYRKIAQIVIPEQLPNGGGGQVDKEISAIAVDCDGQNRYVKILFSGTREEWGWT